MKKVLGVGIALLLGDFLLEFIGWSCSTHSLGAPVREGPGHNLYRVVWCIAEFSSLAIFWAKKTGEWTAAPVVGNPPHWKGRGGLWVVNGITFSGSRSASAAAFTASENPQTCRHPSACYSMASIAWP